MIVIRSPEQKAHKVSLYGGMRAGVHVCVNVSTLSNMNISKATEPNQIKTEASLGWGKGFYRLGCVHIGEDYLGIRCTRILEIKH